MIFNRQKTLAFCVCRGTNEKDNKQSYSITVVIHIMSRDEMRREMKCRLSHEDEEKPLN